MLAALQRRITTLFSTIHKSLWSERFLRYTYTMCTSILNLIWCDVNSGQPCLKYVISAPSVTHTLILVVRHLSQWLHTVRPPCTPLCPVWGVVWSSNHVWTMFDYTVIVEMHSEGIQVQVAEVVTKQFITLTIWRVTITLQTADRSSPGQARPYYNYMYHFQ